MVTSDIRSSGRYKSCYMVGIQDSFEGFDFVKDFGAVETTQPTAEMLRQPVTTRMGPAFSVPDNCGLLRAYALMYDHNLHDLPVVNAQGRLVGIASRVDLGTAILSNWGIEPESAS